MGILSDFRYRKISHTATVNDFLKEVFRKGIHFCSAAVPAMAAFNFSWTVVALSAVVCFYILCEYRRLTGSPIPVVSRITAYAARKRDEGHFVLGPVTMAFGVLITLIVFPLEVGRIGIFALAFGDGIASLAGKIYGRIRIPYAGGKTLEGSSACFIAVYASTLLCTRDPLLSLEVALLAMLIEVLPLRDYDNLLIPLLISAFVYIHP
ncbi:MAG: Cytidylyltransferase family protein [Spirochaetes bacterium ADurb.Bin269]|jgi:dolichol kinase|nr:MAG: Cytidylyltransferase family protein [Spirochaetes bacterium ADurb.Bin269]